MMDGRRRTHADPSVPVGFADGYPLLLIGTASLVDLKTGRVVWFRDLDRMWGDLREPQPAAETVEALMEGFPELK